MHFKEFFPKWLKIIPWFLFKSPQRAEGVSYTLLVEFKGYIDYLKHRFFTLRKIKPVTICTGILNRSENYLNFVLESVNNMDHKKLVELSIFDCGSTDLPLLEAEIRKKWSGKLTFTVESVKFSRSFTFNLAISNAKTELIFACDADILLPKNLVRLCNRYVSRKCCWFPVLFDLYKDQPAKITNITGRWLPVGMGMFASTKEQFINAGGYSERFKQWGGEDLDLFLGFYRTGILPLRTRCKGMFHNWHESLNPNKK